MYLLGLLLVLDLFKLSVQECPEEISPFGIKVKWHQSAEAINVDSQPVCYNNDHKVQRNCTNNQWIPSLEELEPCLKVVKVFNLTACPPGFYKLSNSNNEYCYHIGSPSNWDMPCFGSGGASVITDLNQVEVEALIDSLNAINMSRYYWLPAQRVKMFNPVVWFIPGPNWGQAIETDDILKYQNLFWKNCLALDIQQKVLVTKTCTEVFPSLCIYVNNIQSPPICPENYKSFRYKPDNGTCYGIEVVDNSMTYDEFVETKCQMPMIDDVHELNRFIFTKIAEDSRLPNDTWCWFGGTNNIIFENIRNSEDDPIVFDLETVINNVGTLALVNSSSVMKCMACEKTATYGNTELMFEYNDVENKIYLTIYFPSGLWKYDYNDKGIQCFSDAEGFVGVIDINDLPYLSIQRNDLESSQYIEKVVYIIDLVTDRSAQYWCEGHTFNFSLISTDKIIVNPKGREVHVFSLIVNYHPVNTWSNDLPDLNEILGILTKTLNVHNVLLMDIYNVTDSYITVLLHVHAPVKTQCEDESHNILETYNHLKDLLEEVLPQFNSTLLRFASALYCLPTTTNNTIELDWELTPIGHISAPKQFCLQSNGLPVKRQCLGSYHRGSIWGPVEGRCDSNYKPTNTTTFLYNVIKGQASSPYASNFLTSGLGFVLSDVQSIIPADIYYLSLSLQQILNIAQENMTKIDIGDINNIAWVMDRVMELDCDYLRLAQTLNSTNVIINSVNDIIELIAQQITDEVNITHVTKNSAYLNETILQKDTYQLAVKPLYVVQISYPAYNNITGLAISKTSESSNFDDMIIRPLYSNSTMNEVLSIENLEVATWLPFKLLSTLEVNTNDSYEEADDYDKLHIIVSVYKNDVVFQELSESHHKTNSRIVSVSIPGYKSNLKYPLPLVFNHINKTKSEGLCGFWDFQTRKISQTSGFWKTEGCFPMYKRRHNATICECFHLTHFSQLIMIPVDYNSEEYFNLLRHAKALDVITLVGSFLSLVGIVGIFITAMVFTNWRKKAGTKVLLQLSTSIAMPLIFIVIMNFDTNIFIVKDNSYVVAEDKKVYCILIGALLHYSILASFMWMLITAVLQFIRYVRVLGVSRPSRFLSKLAVIGWGIPLIPVIIVLSINVDNYVPESSTYKSICYPKGYYFIVAVMVPICVVLLINVILFISVLHAISRGPNENNMKAVDMDLVYAQLRLSIFLVFLLGLTWIFGIFSFTKSLIWSYLFCLTATLQGFVLFIYFIICDPDTRNMWIALVKPPFSATNSRNSISTITG